MEHDQFPDTPIRSYRDLRVWRVGMDLVVNCYRSTERFPRDGVIFESCGLEE